MFSFIKTINILLNEFFTSSATLVIGLIRSLFKNILELAVLNNSFFLMEIYIDKEKDWEWAYLCLLAVQIFLCVLKITFGYIDVLMNLLLYFTGDNFDDTFVLFHCKSYAQKFHHYLNNCHNNIKFTMVLESKDCLLFLDCNLSREGDNFMSLVYRKPSFSGKGISYFSYMPFRLKFNGVIT